VVWLSAYPEASEIDAACGNLSGYDGLYYCRLMNDGEMSFYDFERNTGEILKKLASPTSNILLEEGIQKVNKVTITRFTGTDILVKSINF